MIRTISDDIRSVFSKDAAIFVWPLRNLFTYLFSILFLISSFLPGEGLCELSKIPKLIGHYQQHLQTEDASLSFVGFLWMHYDEGSGHQNEEDHDDLPLFHQCSSGSVYIHETASPSAGLAVQWTATLEDAYRNTYEHHLHHSIFQPPRFS